MKLKFKILTKPSFRISTKIQLHNLYIQSISSKILSKLKLQILPELQLGSDKSYSMTEFLGNMLLLWYTTGIRRKTGGCHNAFLSVPASAVTSIPESSNEASFHLSPFFGLDNCTHASLKGFDWTGGAMLTVRKMKIIKDDQEKCKIMKMIKMVGILGSTFTPWPGQEVAGQPRSLGAERLPIIFIIPIISRLRRGPNHGQDGDIGLNSEIEKMMKLFPS